GDGSARESSTPQRSRNLAPRRGGRCFGARARSRRLRLRRFNRRAPGWTNAAFRTRCLHQRQIVGRLSLSFPLHVYEDHCAMATSTPEERLAALGLTLPAVPT